MKKRFDKIIYVGFVHTIPRYKLMLFWNWLVIHNKKFTNKNFKKFEKAYTKDLLGTKALFRF